MMEMHAYLKSPLIRLRAVEPEDLDFMYLVENDTQLWKYGGTDIPYSRHELRTYIIENSHDIRKDGQLRLVIEDNDGVQVGFADLQDYNAQHDRAEVGILITSERQGRGLGSEALRLLESYAADCLHIHLLYAYVDENNTSSKRLFEGCGFVCAGTLPHWVRRGDSYSATLIYTKVIARNAQ